MLFRCLVSVTLLMAAAYCPAAELLLAGTDLHMVYGPQLDDYDVDGDGLPEILTRTDNDSTITYTAMSLTGAVVWSYDADWAEPDTWLDGFIAFSSPTSREALLTDWYGEYTAVVSTLDNEVVFFAPLRMKGQYDFDGNGTVELVLGGNFDSSFEIWSGSSGVAVAEMPAALERLRTLPNHPNPFNPKTTIAFVAPASGTATVRIVAADGREVWRDTVAVPAPGTVSIDWDGRDAQGRRLPSGVYLARVAMGEQIAAVKLNLLK